jgi:CAAX protease family protein
MTDRKTPNAMSDVVRFVSLTYALTWACWLPVVTDRIAFRSSFGSFLWLAGVFAPSLVALVLTFRRQQGIGTRKLLSRIFHWRVGARWYVFALLYMVAVKLVVAIVYRAMLGAWPHFGNERAIVLLAATLVSTPAQFGEEVGWRGYALPRLGERFGFARASVIVGVIWACWHLPQFFLSGADTFRQSFPIWALEIIALSVAITWVYVHTEGSLLLAMLMHAAINNTKDIVPSGSANAKDAFSLHASSVMYLTTAVLWAAAAYFLARIPVAPKQKQ